MQKVVMDSATVWDPPTVKDSLIQTVAQGTGTADRMKGLDSLIQKVAQEIHLEEVVTGTVDRMKGLDSLMQKVVRGVEKAAPTVKAVGNVMRWAMVSVMDSSTATQ
jgi:hypothetical protein